MRGKILQKHATRDDVIIAFFRRGIEMPTRAMWRIYTATPDLGKRADAPLYGQHIVSDQFFHIKIDGLESGQTVYYRVAVAPVTFKERFIIERGTAQYSPIHSPHSTNLPKKLLFR